MKVTLVVEMCAEVPDGTDLDGLCLDMDVNMITVENFDMGEVKGARVTSYETKDVLIDRA